MYEKIVSKFTFDSPNVTNPQVWFCAAIIWITVVICALTSIAGRPWRRRTKLLWAVVVIALPLVGVLLYLPFSINEELFPYIGFWRKPRI